MRPFPHYLLFLVFPFGLLIAISYSSVVTPTASGKPLGKAAVILLCVMLLPLLYWSRGVTKADMEALAKIPATPECDVCGTLSRYAKPGDLVSIWGWEPQVFVMTGTIFSTHESFAEHQMVPYPRLDYYRKRYLDDMRSRPPLIFLDAVGPGMFVVDQAKYGLQTWPALESFIKTQYQLVEEVAGYKMYRRQQTERSK